MKYLCLHKSRQKEFPYYVRQLNTIRNKVVIHSSKYENCFNIKITVIRSSVIKELYL